MTNSRSFKRLYSAISENLPNLSTSEADILSCMLVGGQRRIIFPSYLIPVDYDMSIEEIAKDSPYDWLGNLINEKNFPPSQTGFSLLVVYRVNFKQELRTKDILQELDALDLRPATLKELMVYGSTYPETLSKHMVVALGSSHKSIRINYPYVSAGGSGKGVSCYDNLEWPTNWQFLATRKNESSDPS